MDFDKYVNSLNELDNQENRAELEGFYTLHSSVFQFFKAIDKTIHEVLKKTNVSETIVKQLENVLPALTKLRREINKLDAETFAYGYKTKINQAVAHIKNEMTIGEVNDVAQDFFDLLKENKKALDREQKTKAEKQAEAERKAREEKEQKEHERKEKERLKQAEIERKAREKKAREEKIKEEKRRKATPQFPICTKKLGPFEYGIVSRNHTCYYCGQMLTFYNYGDFQCPACRRNINLYIPYTCKKCAYSMTVQCITHRYPEMSLECPKCKKRFTLPKEFQIPNPNKKDATEEEKMSGWEKAFVAAIVVVGLIFFLSSC